MSTLYDRQFKLGFAISVGLFLVGNVVSYFLAVREYYSLEEKLQFSQFSGRLVVMPSWGFPFSYWGYSTLLVADVSLGLVLNFTSAIVASFMIGFVFRRVFRC